MKGILFKGTTLLPLSLYSLGLIYHDSAKNDENSIKNNLKEICQRNLSGKTQGISLNFWLGHVRFSNMTRGSQL